MSNRKVVLLLAAVATGLNAGVFFAFSTAINPALGRLSDPAFIKAMQEIDEVIQNPVFFLAFFGGVILLPAAAYMYRRANPQVFRLVLISAILYVIGGFGVTSVGNIPLNDKLAKVSVDTSSASQLATARSDFLGPWNRWHTIRTVATIVALGTIVAAAMLPETRAESNTAK